VCVCVYWGLWWREVWCLLLAVPCQVCGNKSFLRDVYMAPGTTCGCASPDGRWRMGHAGFPNPLPLTAIRIIKKKKRHAPGKPRNDPGYGLASTWKFNFCAGHIRDGGKSHFEMYMHFRSNRIRRQNQLMDLNGCLLLDSQNQTKINSDGREDQVKSSKCSR
jgi:hypothetical protein